MALLPLKYHKRAGDSVPSFPQTEICFGAVCFSLFTHKLESLLGGYKGQKNPNPILSLVHCFLLTIVLINECPKTEKKHR